MPCVLILGCGYVGRLLMREAVVKGYSVIPVSRSAEQVLRWQKEGYHALFQQDTPASLNDAVLQHVTTMIDSIPLEKNGVIRAGQPDWLPDLLQLCPKLRHAIYLSSTSVYGNADGAWVNEAWVCQPESSRGKARLKAEQAWLHAMKGRGQAVSIFRLAGIYGENRNIYERLQQGGYRAIRWQPDHFSNRVHVVDIVRALCVAISTQATGIFNISDDRPTSHADYVTALANALDAPAPILLSPAEGKQQLSPAMLSFFQDSKRIDNSRMHDELLPRLRYPSFVDAVKEFVTSLCKIGPSF